MSLRNDMVLRRVLAVPWSLVLTCAPVAYVLVAYVLPAAAGASPFRPILERLGRQFALVTTGAIVLIALLLAFSQRRGRRLLDQQTGLDSIRRLTWLEFERLVGEAYRRHGYSVIPTGGPGADGGVDLVLSKDGGKFLVQCKQWKANRVGVKEIRELFGVVNAERAKGGILVTSGRFTEEAMAFAAGKPLQLVAGGDFLELVRLAQPAQSPPAFSASARGPYQCNGAGGSGAGLPEMRWQNGSSDLQTGRQYRLALLGMLQLPKMSRDPQRIGCEYLRVGMGLECFSFRCPPGRAGQRLRCLSIDIPREARRPPTRWFFGS